MKVYGTCGVVRWAGTAAIVGEDFRFDRHGGEGVISGYARAWYLDHVDRWKCRFGWSVPTEVKDGWYRMIGSWLKDRMGFLDLGI